MITLIRESKNVEAARAGLMERFGLSEIQADEILKMQLQRLTALERQKIVDELTDVRALIADLRDILASARRIDAIVGEEILKLREESR